MTRITTTFENAGLDRADVVFVENRWMEQRLRSRHNRAAVVFAPPGVDTDFLRPAVYQEGGFLLSVGRFSDPRKNVRMLFQAYRRLRDSLPSVPKLVLAGKTPLQAADAKFAMELGIMKHVEFYQDPSASELAALYRGASLFVLASDEEGLGIVILEAMASGLPVVSTRSGGPETAVIDGATGFLTPVGDAAALSTRMRELLQDVTRRKSMGKMGREIAEQRFSIAAAGQSYLDAYAQLLDRTSQAQHVRN